MAFRDITQRMYNDTIQIDYKDKAHKYYARPVVDGQPVGATNNQNLVRGVTTILEGTLEKKGLLTWPMGLALRELFGFYNFENEKGEHMLGFSKKDGGGSILSLDGTLLPLEKDELLPMVLSASEAWHRKQKQGADVGSLVHDAIEQYVNGTPFALTLERYEEGQLWFTGVPGVVSSEKEHQDREEWLKTAPDELEMAKLAYGRFTEWWKTTHPELLEAENVVYSKKDNYCGSYDARLGINADHHPLGATWKQEFGDKPLKVMTDWKTSNASVSAGAPMGVYYSYFIQDAAYAKALYEMTGELVDDLLVVSARKDGSFDTVYASQLGLTVQDCIDWWEAVVVCYRLMVKTKKELVDLHKILEQKKALDSAESEE